MTSTTRQDPLADVFASSGSVRRSIDSVLRAARAHLGMDVAFLSQFTGNDRVLRSVDVGRAAMPFRAGDVLEMTAGYCQRIVDGVLPELIADTGTVPAANALPETHAIPIGAHLSVPVRLANGYVYGTFCCFSFLPDPTLNERDLGMMRSLAGLVAAQLDSEFASGLQHEEASRRIRGVLAGGEPAMVYQPIFGLDDGGIEGVECLARFTAEPRRPPNEWFDEASAVGLGVELELQAIRKALSELGSLPGDFTIAINCSPQAIIGGQITASVRGQKARRIVLEITEHACVENYVALRQALVPLRASGVRVAIDDTGAGYSSMRHILTIDPDVIKLDISLTRNIHRDRRRRALAGAMLEFARHTGSSIVAEGVENAEELLTLRELGVKEAQGYHLARPMPLVELAALLARRQG